MNIQIKSVQKSCFFSYSFTLGFLYLFVHQLKGSRHSSSFFLQCMNNLLSQILSHFLTRSTWFLFPKYRYYDDAACVLRKMFLDAKAPHLSSAIPPILPWKVNEPSQPTEGLTRQGSGIIGTFGQSEELRCVIAIIRQYVVFIVVHLLVLVKYLFSFLS